MSHDIEKLCVLEKRVLELETRLDEMVVKASPDALLDALEVCELANISERAFYYLKEQGNAPKQIAFSARSVRYRRGDVLAWIDENELMEAGK